jgi:Protein of unknown function (DUF3987)
VKGGMSSGEGIIEAIRDPVKKSTEQQDDPGVADKRLLLREAELSRMFRVMTRQGNILSDIVRCAWDGTTLQTLTKKPLRATDPHVSVAGDITVDELRKFLGRLDLVNGFANRFLFVCTTRSKFLPEGGGVPEDDINDLAAQVRKALAVAHKIGQVKRTLDARELWEKMYLELSAEWPGLLGAATSRAVAQVLRLSLIYALLDGSGLVRPQHLKAAREVWRYCGDSARYVIGDAHDPFLERILVALRDAGKDGLSGTQVRDVFRRHARIKDTTGALTQLVAAGLATKVQVKTEGRPKSMWFATE